MNKILNFSLGNQMFAIQENAYEDLDNYISTLITYFKDDKDSEEIISDLENRIAEIFTECTSKKKPFVTQKDVDEMIVKLGKTEDFDPVQKEAGGESELGVFFTKVRKKLQKKLTEESDNRVIGIHISKNGLKFHPFTKQKTNIVIEQN